MTIQYTSFAYADSYCKAVDTVARERKYLGSTEGFPPESSFAFVRTIIENNYAQYVTIENNQVIGWCDIIPKSYEGLRHVGVVGMGVLAGYRGQGIGSRLLATALQHAREVSLLEKIELEVFESNSAAIALYKKYDFEIEGQREKGRKLDGCYDNIILMRKYL